MTWLEALILGILQGLTEFLPISSSGHLEIGKVLLGTEVEQSMLFTVVVHGATVFSIIVVFWKDIFQIISRSLTFRLNDSTLYVLKIFISMIPVLIVGLFFKERVESFYTGNLQFVGAMLLITAALLTFSHFYNPANKKITYASAFLIGISQALAVFPGISRSGATISTGLLLGGKREEVTRFSFLMVLIPIIGANILDLAEFEASMEIQSRLIPLLVGFIAAFISGLFACKWMIKIISQGKWLYFAFYCVAIGMIALVFG
ncbi:MAG: undecaprenyl-diphosphate phosphatase [Bacteroidales bacterium]